jgi:hypothetical protein
MKSIAIAFVAVLVLASCGQASSPAERQEQREGVERAQKEPKEEAPDTPQEIEALSDKDTIALGECQLRKMVEDRGQKATEAWMDEKVQEIADAPKDAEVTSIQVDLLAEGYTCTPEEVKAVQAARSAAAEATARAMAEEEAQTEKEWAASAKARADEVQLSAEGECRIEEYAREQDFEPDLLKVNVSDYMKVEDASEEEALKFFDVPHYASCS